MAKTSTIGLAAKATMVTAATSGIMAIIIAPIMYIFVRMDADAASGLATRVSVIARATELGLPGGRIEYAPDGSIRRVRALGLPKPGDTSVVDHALGSASIYRLDPASGDLARDWSSLDRSTGRRPDGLVPGGSPLAQATQRGEIVSTRLASAGTTRIERYVPIVTPDNKVLGTIGTELVLDEIEAIFSAKVQSIIVVMSSFTIILVIATYILLGWLLKPVRAMASGIDALANDGEPATKAFVRRGDEIGLIARAIETLGRSLAERRDMRSREDQRKSVEDARRSRMEKAVATFDQAVNQVVSRVDSRSRSIGNATATVGDSADGANASARETVSATDQTLSSVTGIAGATEELNASISEIRRQTEAAVSISQEANGAVDIATADVSGLAEAAGRIGEVVQLIRAIAGQTNLLALNATIEAARAGESGRGFAVVASEVKQLASQTARATEDISSQVSAIQSATNRTTLSMENIAGTMMKMRNANDAISGAIDQQASATGEINLSVNRAADIAELAGKSIGTVSQRLGTVGSAVQSLNDVAGDLATDVSDLRRAVETFLSEVRAA